MLNTIQFWLLEILKTYFTNGLYFDFRLCQRWRCAFFFCFETLFQTPHPEFMVPDFGRPTQLFGSEGCLYTSVNAFWHIDSEVMSVDLVKS